RAVHVEHRARDREIVWRRVEQRIRQSLRHVHLFSHQVPPRLAASSGPVQMHVSQGLPYPLFHSTPHDLAITSAVLDVHRSTGLDVLHAHYALPHAVSALLARLAASQDHGRAPPRVVTTLHGTDITIVGSDPSYAPLTDFVIRSSDAVTTVSESLRAATIAHFCDARSKTCAIEVIPNFVDTQRFQPRNGAPRRAGPPHAVHVSNFRPVKRVPWLVEAFALASRGTSARLTLIGDGPDQAAARDKARELEIGARVRFLGERDALPELLADADLFLLASREESFGLSALEAMSCGVPVLATRVGGLPEVVEHGRTGLLAPPDEIATYARHLGELLGDPARCAAMGAAAREVAVEKFEQGRIVGRYEDLYRRVLARAPHPN
ncbi:MAG: N-acetyl-alpha-D-glucosaminyl L-malate synthase BshA, partial [Planctomycetota bacterium]